LNSCQVQFSCNKNVFDRSYSREKTSLYEVYVSAKFSLLVDGAVVTHWHQSQASEAATFYGCFQIGLYVLQCAETTISSSYFPGCVASMWRRSLTLGKSCWWQPNSASITCRRCFLLHLPFFGPLFDFCWNHNKAVNYWCHAVCLL